MDAERAFQDALANLQDATSIPERQVRDDGHLLPLRDGRGRIMQGTDHITNRRPREIAEFRLKCRLWMGQKDGGFDQLVRLASDWGNRDQLPAIQTIAAYGFGKPPSQDRSDAPSSAPILIQFNNYEDGAKQKFVEGVKDIAVQFRELEQPGDYDD